MKHAFLILNPNAGMGVARDRLYDIITAFSEEGYATTVCPLLLDRGVTSEALLKEAGTGYEVVVCFGGDGTLSHMINDYIRLGLTQPIGYLPDGSTNDFARTLGIPSDSIAGVQNIAAGQVFRYDVGVFNDRYFNYIAAFGAFTKVAYETNQTFKNVLGYAAYILSALFNVAESVNIRCPMLIEHDGVKKEGSYVFGAVSNSTSVAGFRVPFGSEARMDDGLFEIVLIRAPESFSDFAEIIGCLMTGNLNSPYIEVFQSKEITIVPRSKVAWTLDGEYGGMPDTIHITALRQRIPMIVSGPQAGQV